MSSLPRITLAESFGSYLTAGVFLIAVGSIFWVFQGQGPESTVERYINAVTSGDLRSEAELIPGSVDSQSAGLLRSQIVELAKEHPVASVVDSYSLSNEAVVKVKFETRYGVFVLPFDLVKLHVRWKVDTQKTWDYIAQSWNL